MPFSWSQMDSVPWEHSRAVLDIWAYYETYGNQAYGPFTRRLAKWSWRVMQAFEMTPGHEDRQADLEPTPMDVLVVAPESPGAK